MIDKKCLNSLLVKKKKYICQCLSELAIRFNNNFQGLVASKDAIYIFIHTHTQKALGHCFKQCKWLKYFWKIICP